MSMLTRGKRALKASLEEHQAAKLTKRTDPTSDAKFWCHCGLDKDGFEKKFISDEVGYGLFTTRQFEKGEFLLEYVGERISPKMAKEREKTYAKQDSKTYPRCYIYHYKFNGKEQCIDATKTKGRLCQFANDAPSRTIDCNSNMKLKTFDGYPRLCLFATRLITKGEEVRYDYGEDDCKMAWREKERQSKDEQEHADSDENPFDLPDSSVGQSSELDTNTEVSEESDYFDTDMSDAKDPSYKPVETQSEISCSSYSDYIPNTDDTFVPCSNFGSFLGKRLRNQHTTEITEELTGKDDHQKFSGTKRRIESLQWSDVSDNRATCAENKQGEKILQRPVERIRNLSNAGSRQEAKVLQARDETNKNLTNDEPNQRGGIPQLPVESDERLIFDEPNQRGGIPQLPVESDERIIFDEPNQRGGIPQLPVGSDEQLKLDEPNQRGGIPQLPVGSDEQLTFDEPNQRGGIPQLPVGSDEQLKLDEPNQRGGIPELPVGSDEQLKFDEPNQRGGIPQLPVGSDEWLKFDEPNQRGRTLQWPDCNDERLLYAESQQGGINIQQPGEKNENLPNAETNQTNGSLYWSDRSEEKLMYAESQQGANSQQPPDERNENLTNAEAQQRAEILQGPEVNNDNQPNEGCIENEVNEAGHDREADTHILDNDELPPKPESPATGVTTEVTYEHQTDSDKTFETQASPYSDAIRTMEKQTSGLTCNICNRIFKRKGALTTHLKSHNKEKEDYKRPARVCPFCKDLTFHTQLPRHIQNQHKDIPGVSEAKSMPEKDKNELFENFRKMGIFRYNQAQTALAEPKYLSERKTQNELICCSKCKGFYGRNLFHRHKATCTKDSTTEPMAIHMDVFNNDSDQFSDVVLSCFRRDEIGDTCRNDVTIKLIGRRLFQKIKKNPDNIGETRKTVMNNMRLLARLFLAARCTTNIDTAESLFYRKNFSALEEAIETVTKEDQQLKHGTKSQIYYLLESSQEILVAHYYSLDLDDKAHEIEKFQKLLSLNKAVIFGDAIYKTHMNRQNKLRMPEQMANEEDVRKLRQHICQSIQHYVSEFTLVGPHEFVTLRDSICARVTLFNARRGGEPAKLRLRQYNDIKTGRWVNSEQKEKLEECEQKLFKDLEVTYQAGKGSHLVTDFIPKDCRKGLDILTDSETRKRAGVADNNDYVFANTQGSDYHVSGWSTIHKMCIEAKLENPDLLTATKQRHRISTIYAALDVPESERQYFYKHMGHTKEVNLGTYQYPLPIMAMTKVGKHLQDIDKALSSKETVTGLSESAAGDEVHLPCGSQPDGYEKDKGGVSRMKPFNGKAASSPNRSKTVPCKSAAGDEEGLPEGKEEAIQNTSITVPSNSVAASRDYFKWTEEDTEDIKTKFQQWILMPSGNVLPSKSELLAFLLEKPRRYNYRQLRTKIMNEQNKNQAIAKKRMEKMKEKR